MAMQFQPRSQVLTGPELLELVGIGPDELAMKSVSDISIRSDVSVKHDHVRLAACASAASH